MSSFLRSIFVAAAVAVVASPAVAQQAMTRGSMLAAVRVVADSARPRTVTTHSDSTVADSAAAVAPSVIRLRPSRSPKLFVALMAGGVLAVRKWHLDTDPGGYQDGFRTETNFPDKGVHALAAWALTNAGVDLKLTPWKSAATVLAAGVGYEFAQGYVSRYDIAADAIGAVAGAGWRTWRNRSK